MRRPLVVASAVGGGSAALGAAGGALAATYFARRVLTPEHLLPDDVTIVSHDATSVTLAATPETVVPGRYGVWIDGGDGHLRVGEILEHDASARTVRRELLSVDRGELREGTGRWNQYFWWDRPSVSLGLPDVEVMVESEVGALPAWVVTPPGGATRDWAILVHGRGARKEETLRAVPVLRAAGWTSLVAAYRNDRDAPRAPDGRYQLGLSEWRDVDAAMAYALANGAERILLCGWSMGGAIVLQALDRSALAERVVGVVLDSAVLDWTAVLRHHGRLNHLPGPLVRVSQALMGSSSARHVLGVVEPLDLTRTDWVRRADELHVPMLVVHSDGDDFVPIGPAAALAERRPDIVRFERWQLARHCKEWNVDPDRWERVLREFVADVPAQVPAPASAGRARVGA